MSVDWSEVEPSPELLKQTLTMFEVVELLGFEINSQGKITSPWRPDERTPSAHVYEDGVYDFGSGQSADIIALVRMLNPDWSFGKAVRQLWNRALKAGREPGDVEKSEPRQLADFTDQLPALVNSADFYGWCTRLGVDLPGHCRVLDGNLLIPHCDSEGCYGVKVREPGGAKSAWPGSQFTKRLYVPVGWHHRMPTVAVITEGESDCWALAPHVAARVFALPSGAGAWRDHWLEDLEPYDKVILCFDNDRAGKEARDKITRKVGYLRAEQLYVPPAYNDVREAIIAGWRPTHPCLGQ